MNIPKIKVPPKLGGLYNAAKTVIACNSPSIMTGIAAGLSVALVYSSGKAAIKSNEAIKQLPPEADRLDKLKVSAPYWVETGLVLTATEACIFGANRMHNKQLATLAGVCSLREQTIKDQQTKIQEIVGKKKAVEIEQAVDKEGIKRDKRNGVNVIDTGRGDTLFKDEWSGQYFLSNYNYVEKVVNDLNKELNRHGNDLYFVALNDLYENWGIESRHCGVERGWSSLDEHIELTVDPVYLDNDPNIVYHVIKLNHGTIYDDSPIYIPT